jgi:hypothetical protein
MAAMSMTAGDGAGGLRAMLAAVIRTHGAPPQYGTHLVPRRGPGQAATP